MAGYKQSYSSPSTYSSASYSSNGNLSANSSGKQPRLSRLEKRIQAFARHGIVEGQSIAPDQLNAMRAQYIEKNLRPVERQGGTHYYRTLQKDNSGMLHVSYSPKRPELPQTVAHVSDTETVSYDVAAKILGAKKNQVRGLAKQLVTAGRLSRKGRKIPLGVLNQVLQEQYQAATAGQRQQG